MPAFTWTTCMQKSARGGIAYCLSGYLFLQEILQEAIQYLSMIAEEEQARHINLTIVFVHEPENRTRSLPYAIRYFPESRELRLNEAMDDTCHRIFNIQGAQLFQTDFYNKRHIFLGIYPFKHQVRIHYSTIVNDCIQINVRQCPAGIMHEVADGHSEEADARRTAPKNKKVKQRTVIEALEAVKLWRRLYDTDDGTGKRLYNLDQAARIVGIAKKTLDDYYSLIRAAKNFNVSLERMRECRLGMLRKFVRIGKEEGQEGLNNQMPEYIFDMEIDKYMNIDDL